MAIIQARMNSSRLPGKVLFELYGKPMLLNIIERVSRSKHLDKVVVATSNKESDDSIVQLVEGYGFDCFRGDLDNVLDRFYSCAKNYQPKSVVRLTADNALVDSGIIDEAIETFEKEKVDYLYYKSTLPLGMCVEVFTFAALTKAHIEATNKECLEHVTPYIKNNKQKFKILNYVKVGDVDYSNLRFTMDTKEDYKFVKNFYQYFAGNDFSYKDLLNALKIHPEWIQINNMIVQNRVSYYGDDEIGRNATIASHKNNG